MMLTMIPPIRPKELPEDTWLSVAPDETDRNLLDSQRRLKLNPDMPSLHVLHCYCGNDIHTGSDWYAMVADGTLVCHHCAKCSRCSRESVQISRRLVSVDGLVLCYWCIKLYGYKQYPKLHLRTVTYPLKDPLAMTKSEDEPRGSNVNNEAVYYAYNVNRTDRCRYTPKEDMRKLIRYRYYETPSKPLSLEDNPYITAPPYLAVDGTNKQRMVCPSCSVISQGQSTYVVPSMARVYHKRCFRCCNCKISLAHGMQLPGVNFQYCSCSVPLVWCTRPACIDSRLQHHTVTKCQLDCLRPGGRCQMDCTEELADVKMKRRRRVKRKEHNDPPAASYSIDTSSTPTANQGQK